MSGIRMSPSRGNISRCRTSALRLVVGDSGDHRLDVVWLCIVRTAATRQRIGSILAMPLLAIPAVFCGLWLTGIELNISAMMGMTMIVGIVTEVAIFYFSELQETSVDLTLHEALHEAGRHRTRPIVMSTLAAILTLLPLALALGQGSQMQQPLAVAIISGMLMQLPLVLLVMPVLYAQLQPRRLNP
jgi:multidrug efflux pump subunit AcrB